MQSEHDYSQVHFPGEITNCYGCHDGSQADRWETSFTRKTCGSCHDRTYYGEDEVPEGYTLHTAGPRLDSECIVCHAEDSISPITLRHQIGVFAPNAPEVEVTIDDIENTAPGDSPELTFSVTLSGDAVDVIASPPARLRMVIAGPNSDYAQYWQENIHDAPECADTPVAPCIAAEGDLFRYYSETPIPGDAEGSWTVGMGARFDIDDERYAAVNPTVATRHWPSTEALNAVPKSA